MAAPHWVASPLWQGLPTLPRDRPKVSSWGVLETFGPPRWPGPETGPQRGSLKDRFSLAVARPGLHVAEALPLTALERQVVEEQPAIQPHRAGVAVVGQPRDQPVDFELALGIRPELARVLARQRVLGRAESDGDLCVGTR